MTVEAGESVQAPFGVFGVVTWIVGSWQQIYYAEFDGQRKKRVIVKVMGE